MWPSRELGVAYIDPLRFWNRLGGTFAASGTVLMAWMHSLPTSLLYTSKDTQQPWCRKATGTNPIHHLIDDLYCRSKPVGFPFRLQLAFVVAQGFPRSPWRCSISVWYLDLLFYEVEPRASSTPDCLRKMRFDGIFWSLYVAEIYNIWHILGSVLEGLSSVKPVTGLGLDNDSKLLFTPQNSLIQRRRRSYWDWLSPHDLPYSLTSLSSIARLFSSRTT